jgi:hypothetical protein
MMWLSGYGWGTCGLVANVLAMALLWGAIFTTVLLAINFFARGANSPSTMTVDNAAHSVRTDAHNDEFYRRLM